MKYLVSGFLLAFLLGSSAAIAETDYQTNMENTFVRGLKNTVTGVSEIPSSTQAYEAHHGERKIQTVAAGLVHGITRTIERTGSGLFDLVLSIVPGFQEGLPVEPETTF